MPAPQTIDLYCLCWNDAKMLPHFFRHYDPWVDRYFVYDNGSTDESIDMLYAHEKVTVRHFEVAGNSFVDVERRLSDKIWLKSRGTARWVVMVDIDEFIFRPDLRGYLQRCTDTGITALRGIGYEMVDDEFPVGAEPLVESITLGTRSAGHDKLVLFNPDALTDTRYEPGRHKASPVGNVVWPDRSQILLLHYKQLGPDYVIERSAELRLGLRDGDVEQGWGKQYLWSPEEITKRWTELKSVAVPVPGIGRLSHIAPEHYDEERLIGDSGLFDAPWYLATYPDVAAAGENPLTHYSMYGWKEGRKPNFYFQPPWYTDRTPGAEEEGVNPLVHYILKGEPNGAPPSPWFDPAWYRAQYGIAPSESPLRHYLQHRTGGQFSPSPEFAARPDLVPGTDGTDMGAENLDLQPQEPAMATMFPSYEEFVSLVGRDPRTAETDLTLEPSVLVDLVRLFLRTVEVDEAGYRRAYPDVAESLDDGSLTSARQHYIEFGYFEGRNPRPESAA